MITDSFWSILDCIPKADGFVYQIIVPAVAKAGHHAEVRLAQPTVLDEAVEFIRARAEPCSQAKARKLSLRQAPVQ